MLLTLTLTQYNFNADFYKSDVLIYFVRLFQYLFLPHFITHSWIRSSDNKSHEKYAGGGLFLHQKVTIFHKHKRIRQ
jgi:hypothetical protein